MIKTVYYVVDDYGMPLPSIVSSRDSMETLAQKRITEFVDLGYVLNDIWRNPNDEKSGLIHLLKVDKQITINFGHQDVYFPEEANDGN